MKRPAVCFLLAAPLLAQAPSRVPPDLQFEVVSLKPSQPLGRGAISGIRPAAGGQRYEATNCTVKTMIGVAYRVKDEQIVGGPEWLGTDRFDMEAKAEKSSNGDELHAMLMNMLVDRMQLKFHHEKKEMRMYALTVGPGGAQLTPHAAANAGEPWIEQTQQPFLHMKMKATSVPLDYFAFRLGLGMDLPVVDLTGLKGDYDFNLEYTRDLPLNFPEGGLVNGEAPDTSGPSIFQAVKQQLGLELKAQKGSVDVIVIDRAERPTAN
jgi:uncharacterized protein (TIGR03435 family)